VIWRWRSGSQFARAKCNLTEVPDIAVALTNAEIEGRNRQAWISKTILPLIENSG
jgi:hypothetical protein